MIIPEAMAYTFRLLHFFFHFLNRQCLVRKKKSKQSYQKYMKNGKYFCFAIGFKYNNQQWHDAEMNNARLSQGNNCNSRYMVLIENYSSSTFFVILPVKSLKYSIFPVRKHDFLAFTCLFVCC